MTNKTFANVLLAVAFALCLACGGCKKDDKNAILGNWKMTAYIHNGVDVYNTQVPSCVTDDIITFTNDQKIINDEGPTKCAATDPQTETGTYSLNNDKTQLTVVTNGGSEVYNVQTLNSTTLKLQEVSNEDLVTYTKK